MKVYKSAEELIGRTPILEIDEINHTKIWAKLECFNPAGSVKDRVGAWMIKDAMQKGKINKDTVIIEPTSGNTGIGIVSYAASHGLKAIIVMPETMSDERKKLMRAYGAELVLTDGKLGMAGAIDKANELSHKIKNSFIPAQFENPANAEIHFKTTGPEIWDDTDGTVDIFVAGVGTGGTITGVGRFLKSKNPNIKIVAVEPKSSAVLSGEQAGSHGIQGIGAGFVPKVLDTSVYDEVITVSEDEAYKTAKDTGKTKGVLVGISSGAALFAAYKLAQREENSGKKIVVLLPDGGDRYLSTTLFN